MRVVKKNRKRKNMYIQGKTTVSCTHLKLTAQYVCQFHTPIVYYSVFINV